MHFCTNCGDRHEESADFCTNCGERIVVEIHAQPPVAPLASSAAPQPPVAPPACSAAPQPQETQPPVAPRQPQMIQPEHTASKQPEQPEQPEQPKQPEQPEQPEQPTQPKNRKKSDLPIFVIPAAAAAFLLSACALLFLFGFILKDYTNGDERNPPVIENHTPVTETADTPKPAEVPSLIETPQPAPTDTPDGGPSTDDGSETAQALFTGKASDYAAMPKTYGEARNLLGYSILDARDVTYENFLKLELGMSLSDVMDILSDAEANSSDYDFFDTDRWWFSSNPTRISVEVSDDKVIEAEFRDPFRVCVDPADISMSAYLQIEAGMSLDEVEGILGGDFFVSAISTGSTKATSLTWYCNEGEITVIFDTSNLVTAYMQAGFQLYADARMNYDVLTNRQIMDNFQKINLGITYPELEVLMENYIPLYEMGVNIITNGKREVYEFNRRSYDDKMSLRFIFHDGMLDNAYSSSTPESLLTTTDYSSALKIGEGMSYSEVVEILGGGYRISVDSSYSGSLREEYKWLLPGKYNNISVKFEDGLVYYEPYIYYED